MLGPMNIFGADANMLAQITGMHPNGLVQAIQPSLPYNIGGTTVIDDDNGIFQQLVTGAGNTTLNTDEVGKAGQLLILEIANDAGGARTITFGGNFRVTAATVVGTASKSILMGFISNGVKYMELFRTTAET